MGIPTNFSLIMYATKIIPVPEIKIISLLRFVMGNNLACMPNKTNKRKGNATGLQCQYSAKSKCANASNARVIPHVGQGIWKRKRIGQEK